MHLVPSRGRSSWAFDMAILAFLLMVFYACWLGHYPVFNPDEGRYAEAAREMVATRDYITPRVNGVIFLDKPALYYWLQALSIWLFGPQEWALRLFPALIGILGCVATYACGRLLFDRLSGLLSALVLGSVPLYFGAAHYANLDLEVAVFISCTLLFFLTGTCQRPKYGKWAFLAAYFFAALAVLTKGLIGIVFPCLTIGTWAILLRRWELPRQIYLPVGAAFFLAVSIPWYFLVQQANPAFVRYFFIDQQVMRFLSMAEFNNPLPVWFYVPVLLAGMFPWTVFLCHSLLHLIEQAKQAGKFQHTALFLLLWPAIVLVFFSVPRSKPIGYILPVLPALALCIGHYLSSNWHRPLQFASRTIMPILVVCGSVIAGLLLALAQYHWLDFAPSFVPYLIGIITIILSTVCCALLIKNPTVPVLFALCLICSVSSLLTLTMGAHHLNQTSAKPLVAKLKRLLGPHDEVAAYFKYFYDVPLYLGKPITIVNDWRSPRIPYTDNWARELWLGMKFQKKYKQLVDEAQFWQHWQRPKAHVYVFVNDNYLKQFAKKAQRFYVVGKENDIFLLSNLPIVEDEKQAI